MLDWFVLKLIDRNSYKTCTKLGMILSAAQLAVAWSGMVHFLFTGGLFSYKLFFFVFFSWVAFFVFTFHLCLRRDLLVSFRKATGQKPLRIIFYRFICLSTITYLLDIYFYLVAAFGDACIKLIPIFVMVLMKSGSMLVYNFSVAITLSYL